MNANEAWIALFRRIPGSLHDALALGLTTGSEIVVQKIVKLEPEFIVIRGRLAGTQDTGRVVMVPYTQLTFVAVQRELKDAEVEGMFGKAGPVAFADLPPVVEEQPAAAPVVEEAPQPVVESTRKPAAPTKSALVAKLRERLKDK
ncbi:MAG: hypothetical protein HY289_00390 [Planctomycetes bacterium]|nr:hypothetical protein [Planctomycetota bacterium]